MLYLLLAVSAALVIALQGVPASDAMFEALSAIGTVGLSKGVTPGLTLLSKAVVILLMYSGRVGSISVLMAVTDRRIKTQINHVEEKIIV
jgi:trk system potassium uptake protein TrkH